jgi:hypothetical protein
MWTLLHKEILHSLPLSSVAANNPGNPETVSHSHVEIQINSVRMV